MKNMEENDNLNQPIAGESCQILKIDETLYEDDPEMIRIIRRLQSAAANKEIRQNMTVEDEFFSAIDTRDAAIAARDATIADHEATIADCEAKISSQKSMLADSCRLLLKSGLSMKDIAKSLKLSMPQLKDLLEK